MPYRPESHEMENYGRMLADAGMQIHAAEMLLDTFVNQIFKQGEGETLDLELEFRCFGDEAVPVIIKNLGFDEEHSHLQVMLDDGRFIPWKEINLIVKSMIADQIHLGLLSDTMYKNLRNQ